MDNIRCPVIFVCTTVDGVIAAGQKLRKLLRTKTSDAPPPAAITTNSASIYFIRDRRCVTREGQGCLPQQFARGLIEGAELLVEIRRPNEDQAARGHDRAAGFPSPC